MADAAQLQNGTKQIPDKITRRRRIFKSFIAKSLANRSFVDRIADDIVSVSGSVSFLIAHIYWFAIWISINIGLIPGVHPFDPFPFGLLTMVVSLEAIVLSVFVLLSQNRQSKIESLRNELNLQVNLIAEEEVTKCLEMLAAINKKLGIKNTGDKELERMLNRIDTSYIERTLQRQVETESQKLITHIIKQNGNDRPKEDDSPQKKS